MVHGMLDEGVDRMPGIGSDIADPDVDRERLRRRRRCGRCCRSSRTAWRRWSTATARSRARCSCSPARRTTSSIRATASYLAETYGGPVERISLERSYHVATLDYDKDLIFDAAVDLRPQGDGLRSPGLLAHRRPRLHPQPVERDDQVGPLQLRAYGLMIALGVARRGVAGGPAAGGAGRRHPRGHLRTIALWAVPAGVIGSRLYHVVTDWRRFEGHWLDVFKIWEGGLGIWGGIGLGVAVGIWAAHAPGHPAAAVASRPSRRRCRWPRPSAGGATGGTRSCSAGRPTCRGRSRSSPGKPSPRATRRHDLPPDVPLRVALVPLPVRRPDLDRQAVQAARAPSCSPCTWPATRSCGSGSSGSASTRPRSSGVGGSTRSSRWWCAAWRSCT